MQYSIAGSLLGKHKFISRRITQRTTSIEFLSTSFSALHLSFIYLETLAVVRGDYT
jgi:hypothetical protein